MNKIKIINMKLLKSKRQGRIRVIVETENKKCFNKKTTYFITLDYNDFIILNEDIISICDIYSMLEEIIKNKLNKSIGG